MDTKKEIQDGQLHDLMRALPAEKPSFGLNARIMDRIRLEKNHLEKQGEKRMLTWAIALVAIILGAGAYALYIYIDWSFLTLPETAQTNSYLSTLTGESLSADYSMLKSLLPFAGIVLFLLIGDLLFRRRFMTKHRPDKSAS